MTLRQGAYRPRAIAGAGSFFLLALLPHSPVSADTVHGTDQVVAAVTIRARAFNPATVKVPVGREVLLVFENQDVELHAFVPLRVLDDIPLHVDGNGAAQFGDHGLVRVLIPSGGRAEIRFMLQRPGLYDYRCDLPGHQMRAQISVEEDAPHQVPP